MPTLFDPVQIGNNTLKNRIILAPLTRMRADDKGVLPEISVEYYAQRATAGLEITEATNISPIAKGYSNTPGLYTEEQLSRWREIVQAVHHANSLISAQLWHTGRISHSSLHPDDASPVSVSNEHATTRTTLIEPDGKPQRVRVSAPKEISIEQIKTTIKDYAQATINSQVAGFDFVEVHAAHGYLLQQFQCAKTNTRQDIYGGSVENRSRFTLEVLDAVIASWDNKHVGIRLSPWANANDISTYGDNELIYYLISEIAKRNIAYLHLSEVDWSANSPSFTLGIRQKIRSLYPGVIIVAGGKYTVATAQELLDQGLIDAVAFGRSYIANPDLPQRLRTGTKLNEPLPQYFYGWEAGLERGYTDYPTLDQQ